MWICQWDWVSAILSLIHTNSTNLWGKNCCHRVPKQRKLHWRTLDNRSVGKPMPHIQNKKKQQTTSLVDEGYSENREIRFHEYDQWFIAMASNDTKRYTLSYIHNWHTNPGKKNRLEGLSIRSNFHADAIQSILLVQITLISFVLFNSFSISLPLSQHGFK